ncbi:MAG: alpha/beta hydrolase family protein [Acidobacteriia bacterium]|nr:alpha/beta hydrolase family protein [Terriglobia bacterium]
MNRWESQLANRDSNRVVRPFEWGLEWLELQESTELEGYSKKSARDSEQFFSYDTVGDYRLDGNTLSFTSPVESPYAENNTVYAEYFPSPKPGGRAVLVIPQWNSDPQGHIGLCKLLNRFGLSALRLSKAYHHKRMPPELRRADYHVSSNLGRTIHATRQSVIDARACLDWMEQKGYRRLGILGTSLGSCVALLTTAHDHRLQAGVFNHVSMNFSDVVWTGLSCRHIRQSLDPHVTQEQMRRIWHVISPAAYLDRLIGRDLKSLLIWANHDTTFLPEFSLEALEGFRKRGIPHQEICLPCGHYTSGKFPFNLWDGLVMCRFLRRML